jgi:hypothetical protein
MSGPRLLPLGAMARRIHVQSRWLASEARAGRLPHVDAGGRILFDAALIERLLLKRAAIIPPVLREGQLIA